MNKKIVLSLSFTGLVLSTNAFAQFKAPAKMTKNLANLERAVTRSANPAIGRPVVMNLPAGIVPGNAIGLRRVEMPRVITPVTLSYIQYVRTKGADYLDLIPHNWMGPKGERVLYESQDQLARDLDTFYKGEADIYIGPDGRQVKLYMLPADGILYIPPEYPAPLVLNAGEYFVIYDVEAKTGKIADNTAQVYSLYQRFQPTQLHKNLEDFYMQVKKAVATKTGLTKNLDYKIENVLKRFPEEPTSRSMSQASGGYTFSGADRGLFSLTAPVVQNDYSIYWLEKELGAQSRATGYWKEVWEEKKIPYVFYSEAELGRALYRIHKRFGAVVRNQITEEFFRVYEFPIDGVSILRDDGASVELDGNKYVVLYKNQTMSLLIDRETLENSNNFKFFNHYYLY